MPGEALPSTCTLAENENSRRKLSFFAEPRGRLAQTQGGVAGTLKLGNRRGGRRKKSKIHSLNQSVLESAPALLPWNG